MFLSCSNGLSGVLLDNTLDNSLAVKLITLLMTEKLSEYDKKEILNLIWNLGFDKLCVYNFNYSNPFHKGILVTLLTHYENNPLEPFFPLQQWPELDKLTTSKTCKWEYEMIQLLNIY